MIVNSGKIPNAISSNQNQVVKLKLRKEQLDIVKKWVNTGRVTIRKKVITEEKTIVVPVTRVEFIIENNKSDSENSSEKMKTIRIPISEERIEVVKHLTDLGDIKIYKRQFQKMEHVEETLKNEIAHVEIIGKAKVIDKEDQSELF